MNSQRENEQKVADEINNFQLKSKIDNVCVYTAKHQSMTIIELQAKVSLELKIFRIVVMLVIR